MPPIDGPAFSNGYHELPPTPDALRTECERLRNHILDNAKLALPALPCSDANSNANFAALLKGERRGFMLPLLERLFLAARALDLKDAPALPREPQTALEAVAALDCLLAALRGAAPVKAGESTKAKHPGGRPRLEAKNPRLANVYERIIAERKSKNEPYSDVASRLQNDKDFVELARATGVTKIGYKLVKRAVDWKKQRGRRDRDEPTNSA